MPLSKLKCMKLKPVLVNPEFQDPILAVPIPQKSEMLLFDLGYCFRLKIRDIQKISRIFITHTHIDHFAGFDHILRLSIDIEKTISIYGPPEFIGNVQGKLAGYYWNLKDSINLNYDVFEIHRDKMLRKQFRAREGYKNDNPPEVITRDLNDPIVETEDYSVYTVFLEHRMPVLGYKIKADDSYNADKSVMDSMNLSPGKWVGELKERLRNDLPDNDEIEIDGKKYNTGKLLENLIKKSPGHIIAYVVDTIFNKKTAGPLKNFVNGADYFFCECTYLTSERDLARRNYHLTARQAGTIAKEGGAKTLIPFHFSRRYEGKYHKLYEEAKEVFPHVEKAKSYIQ